MKKEFIVFAILLLVGCEDKLKWVNAPIVYSMSPDTGTSGTVITIIGANFSGNPSMDRVVINRTSAELVEVSSSTIKFIAPDESSGAVIVTVNNLTAENRPLFTYK